jgi:hypothetical protein
MIHPESERGRGKKNEAIKGAETTGSSYRRPAVAREIVRHAPDLAQQVLTKRMNFEEAPADSALSHIKNPRRLSDDSANAGVSTHHEQAFADVA